MTKRAVCIGIDEYEPYDVHPLKGCVNDAKDWKDILKNKFGFEEVTRLPNNDSTKSNIKNAFKEMIMASRRDDVAVLTLSCHGTWVTDTEQADEPDHRDEAFMAYDGKIIVDDDIRRIIEIMKSGVNLTVIIDSCYSGSGTRSQILNPNNLELTGIRYTPRAKEHFSDMIPLKPIEKRFLSPGLDSQQSNMKEILITACESNEVCYETSENGRYNGALTHEAIRIINENHKLTYRQFHERLRQRLPSDQYPQYPQLEGSYINKNLQLFSTAQKQLFDWAGTCIIFNSVFQKKRWILTPKDQHGNVRKSIPTDVREFICEQDNQKIKKIIKELIDNEGLPQNRDEGSFDKRANIIWKWIAENIKYELDAKAQRILDFWQFPAETLALGEGDCEDCAFLLASLLIASGISPFCVRVVFGKVCFPDGNEVGHCWPVYRSESGSWIILESTLDKVPVNWGNYFADELADENTKPRYSPSICFNQFHLWSIDTGSEIKDIDTEKEEEQEVEAYVKNIIPKNLKEYRDRKRLITSIKLY